MTVERIFRCEGPDCEIHIRTPRDYPPTFLTVRDDESGPSHFCSWDCLMKYAAKFPPTEMIPMEADE